MHSSYCFSCLLGADLGLNPLVGCLKPLGSSDSSISSMLERMSLSRLVEDSVEVVVGR